MYMHISWILYIHTYINHIYIYISIITLVSVWPRNSPATPFYSGFCFLLTFLFNITYKKQIIRPHSLPCQKKIIRKKEKIRVGTAFHFLGDQKSVAYRRLCEPSITTTPEWEWKQTIREKLAYGIAKQRTSLRLLLFQPVMGFITTVNYSINQTPVGVCSESLFHQWQCVFIPVRVREGICRVFSLATVTCQLLAHAHTQIEIEIKGFHIALRLNKFNVTFAFLFTVDSGSLFPLTQIFQFFKTLSIFR